MIRIAIVEDASELRENMLELVNSMDDMLCDFAFADAESAYEHLSKEKVDVVLMDIHLPGMNGIECVGKLRQVHPEMLFIMCTIFQDDENVFNALKAGASGYLLKLNEAESITNSIREIYSGGSPMSPQIARKVLESFSKPQKASASEVLTKREMEILTELSLGLRYKEIAAKLFISTDTVRKHINNIYQKLQVQSKMEAVNKVFRN